MRRHRANAIRRHVAFVFVLFVFFIVAAAFA